MPTEDRATRARSGVAVAVLLILFGGCSTTSVEPWDASSGLPPPRRVTLRVEGRVQARNLSCESRTACDLLGYLGRSVQEATFLGGLPLSDNPDVGFVGDVDGPSGRLPPEGYGVHAPPIATRLRELGVPARAERGVDLAWLVREIAEGRPVIVWATAGLDAGRPVSFTDARGRSFVAVRGEHTFLAIGYGPDTVRLLDPGWGEARDVDRGRFDSSWASLGRMAVAADR